MFIDYAVSVDDAGLAHLVEQLTSNEQVASSILAAGSMALQLEWRSTCLKNRGRWFESIRGHCQHNGKKRIGL